jgi:hypothetical protein
MDFTNLDLHDHLAIDEHVDPVANVQVHRLCTAAAPRTSRARMSCASSVAKRTETSPVSSPGASRIGPKACALSIGCAATPSRCTTRAARCQNDARGHTSLNAGALPGASGVSRWWGARAWSARVRVRRITSTARLRKSVGGAHGARALTPVDSTVTGWSRNIGFFPPAAGRGRRGSDATSGARLFRSDATGTSRDQPAKCGPRRAARNSRLIVSRRP